MDISKMEQLYPDCLNDGRIVSAGVGLKEGELWAYQSIAKAIGVRTNAIMRLALRDWLNRVRDGSINVYDYVVEPPVVNRKIAIPDGTTTEK